MAIRPTCVMSTSAQTLHTTSPYRELEHPPENCDEHEWQDHRNLGVREARGERAGELGEKQINTTPYGGEIPHSPAEMVSSGRRPDGVLCDFVSLLVC